MITSLSKRKAALVGIALTWGLSMWIGRKAAVRVRVIQPVKPADTMTRYWTYWDSRRTYSLHTHE